jgi:hypothetical protein
MDIRLQSTILCSDRSLESFSSEVNTRVVEAARVVIKPQSNLQYEPSENAAMHTVVECDDDLLFIQFTMNGAVLKRFATATGDSFVLPPQTKAVITNASFTKRAVIIETVFKPKKQDS